MSASAERLDIPLRELAAVPPEEAVRILPKRVTRPREHTLHEDAAEPARGRGSARSVEHDDVAASPPDEFESENAVLRVSLAPGRRP